MADKMWMGIPTKHMQFVPCPSITSTITRKRYVERLQFENGGGDVKRSPAYQMEYELNFTGLAHEVDGIDAFNKFASGFYGNGLIYLAHPANFETNMFSAGWATPGLAEQGWPKISSNDPTFINSGATGVDSYGQPMRTAVYVIDSPANAIPSKYRFTIPIPPTHTLQLGASGSVIAGDATVQVRAIFANGTYDTPHALALQDPDSSSRMTEEFAGSTYQAVEVYLMRTSSAPAELSLTSMMGILRSSSSSWIDKTNHYPGEGSTGLMFIDSAIVETYAYMYPPRKGISTTLAEVEAWR
jgi:hypothetical protein